MTNQELFSQAIADAKAVRDAAVANAKAALEETFTPKIMSMLSAKLNELEEEGLEEKMEKEENIELVSLTHFRGRTFNNSVCIVDEFQNLTKQQLQMVLGRLGKNSIMILCGDKQQIDLKFK